MNKNLIKLERLVNEFLKEIDVLIIDGPAHIEDVNTALNILNFSAKVMPEHEFFVNLAIKDINYRRKYYGILQNYMNRIKQFIEIEKSFEEKIEKKGLFLGAEEKLKEAVSIFDELRKGGARNFGSVFSPLGTCIDLVLKDKLDIPISIRNMNVKKMLNALKNNDILPKYCDEIYKRVYDVRSKIEHHGYKPEKTETIEAIKLTEDFMRKFKKLGISSDTKKQILNNL